MSGTERVDEILRLIDAVLEGTDAPQSHPNADAEPAAA